MRNCVVVINISNIVGSLNHCLRNQDGSYEKLRIDYKKLLDYLVADRNLLGAFVISQHDITYAKNRSQDSLQSNQKFLSKLKSFGWTPVRVSYDAASNDMTPVYDAIWTNVMATMIDATGNLTVNPSLTDIVFMTGSVSWFEIIDTFFNNQFSTEVAYIKQATSKQILANFAFFDITSFIINNSRELANRKLQTISTNSEVPVEHI